MGLAAAQGRFRSDIGRVGGRGRPVCRIAPARPVKSARYAGNRRRPRSQPADLCRRRACNHRRRYDRGREPRRHPGSASTRPRRIGTQFARLLCHAAQRLPAAPRGRDQRGKAAGSRRARRHLLPECHDASRATGRHQMSVAAKICGLSTEAAVMEAIAGGAAYLGFVFYPPSPRAVTADQAARLCNAVPSGITRVGLFVDADDDTIGAVLAKAPIDLLQLHGHESPDRVENVKLRFARPVMKAVAIAAPEDVLEAARYEEIADLLLFDAKPPHRSNALPGGNGLAFDWELIAGRSWRVPWMLSGGLTAESLPEAVRISGAAAVDVSSGVESRAGVKNPDKIRAFLAAARAL